MWPVPAVGCTVRLSILLFASYADALGGDRVELDLPERASVADVVSELRARPGGATLPPRPLVAVNRRYAAYEQPLRADDELAVIPPVAGG